jgi:hypothetical protein
MATETKRYTLDGEAIDLAEFLAENRDWFTVNEAEHLAAMVPGQLEVVGGGAGAEFLLRCERAEA